MTTSERLSLRFSSETPFLFQKKTGEDSGLGVSPVSVSYDVTYDLTDDRITVVKTEDFPAQRAPKRVHFADQTQDINQHLEGLHYFSQDDGSLASQASSSTASLYALGEGVVVSPLALSVIVGLSFTCTLFTLLLLKAVYLPSAEDSA